MRNLDYQIHPYRDGFDQDGFLVSLRSPYTGEHGQGFYLTKYDAVRALGLAVHRHNSGENALASCGDQWTTLHHWQPLTTPVLRRLYTEVGIL